MSFSIHKVQSFGSLPKPYTISNILDLRSDSKIIIELYDTNPNLVALIHSDNRNIVLKRPSALRLPELSQLIHHMATGKNYRKTAKNTCKIRHRRYTFFVT